MYEEEGFAAMLTSLCLITEYSVDSIKRTILYNVLSVLSVLFSTVISNNFYEKYCISRKKSLWKAKCTVHLIESTE